MGGSFWPIAANDDRQLSAKCGRRLGEVSYLKTLRQPGPSSGGLPFLEMRRPDEVHLWSGTGRGEPWLNSKRYNR